MIENKITNGLEELFENLEEKGVLKETDFKNFYIRGNERIWEAYDISSKKQNLSKYNLSKLSIN